MFIPGVVEVLGVFGEPGTSTSSQFSDQALATNPLGFLALYLSPLLVAMIFFNYLLLTCVKSVVILRYSCSSKYVAHFTRARLLNAKTKPTVRIYLCEMARGENHAHTRGNPSSKTIFLKHTCFKGAHF